MKKYLLISIAIFFFDRLLKILSVNTPGKIFLIPGLVAFDRHINYGIIFSLDFPLRPVLILSAIFMAVILVLLIRSFLSYFYSSSKGEARRGFGWALLFFGALSNFLDRIVYRGTIDYVNILNISLVNLADGLILLGIIVLLFEFKKSQIPMTRS